MREKKKMCKEFLFVFHYFLEIFEIHTLGNDSKNSSRRSNHGRDYDQFIAEEKRVCNNKENEYMSEERIINSGEIQIRIEEGFESGWKIGRVRCARNLFRDLGPNSIYPA